MSAPQRPVNVTMAQVFSSTVIPSVGRPSLSRAVESVLAQQPGGEPFEVIVVNDSGTALPVAGWQSSERVRVVETARRERSVARNTGAALARGQYLHFLDDDDWLEPGGLGHLWSAARATDAAWVYGATQLVDRAGRPLIVLRHTMRGNCFVQAMAGEWVPLQSSLIRADAFFAIGGFNARIAGPEDVDLLRRYCLRGTLEGTPHVVAHVGVGPERSTTDTGRHAAQSRWAREAILDNPGAFARLRASATSSYWSGRILRAYATSFAWNARRARLVPAASRAAFGAASMFLAGGRAFSADYWRAVSGPHRSDVFDRGARAAARLDDAAG